MPEHRRSPTDDPKSEAQTFTDRVALLERIEDDICPFRFNTDSGIDHLDDNTAASPSTA